MVVEKAMTQKPKLNCLETQLLKRRRSGGLPDAHHAIESRKALGAQSAAVVVYDAHYVARVLHFEFCVASQTINQNVFRPQYVWIEMNTCQEHIGQLPVKVEDERVVWSIVVQAHIRTNIWTVATLSLVMPGQRINNASSEEEWVELFEALLQIAVRVHDHYILVQEFVRSVSESIGVQHAASQMKVHQFLHILGFSHFQELLCSLDGTFLQKMYPQNLQ